MGDSRYSAAIQFLIRTSHPDGKPCNGRADYRSATGLRLRAANRPFPAHLQIKNRKFAEAFRIAGMPE